MRRPWCAALAGTCLAVVFGASPCRALDAWPYDNGDEDPLFHLHRLVNYRPDPAWERAQERARFARSTVVLSSGSVGTDDLLTAMTLHVTEPVGAGFRFLADLEWLDDPSRENPGPDPYLGLERSVVGAWSLQFTVHPPSAKEELDLFVGSLWTRDERHEYIQLGLRFLDLLYGNKNGAQGTAVQDAVGFAWALRLKYDRIELAGEGEYRTPLERTFGDSASSPEVAREFEQRGASSSRLRYLWSERSLVEFELLHREFHREVDDRDPAGSTRIEEEVLVPSLRSLVALGERWTGRFELHRLRRGKTADRGAHEQYDRSEWMPAAFATWRASDRQSWELGYMLTSYEWSETVTPAPAASTREGTTDKLSLAWIYAPSPAMSLKLLLSHEPDLAKFGGGNVQLRGTF